MFNPIDKWNARLRNALDVDLKITLFAKCPKQVCFNKKGNRACDNGKNISDCKIYASMA